MTALACIQWIRDELEAHNDLETLQPPLIDTDSLCEFVTDGRALCLLANFVLDGEENHLPKKLQRSLKQLSKFHALERVQFFIKWCRTRAKLEEHQVFTTVQLLDEVNETAVSETIIALRNKTRPGYKSTSALSQYCADGDSNNAYMRTSTSSITSTGSSNANNANRLSSFLNKFPSAPVVTTTTLQSKPPMSHHRVSLTSSVASSNPSPREFEEPVPVDEIHSSNSKSRLRIPSIFKNSNNASPASATSRSSVISNASSTASSSKEEGRESRSWSSKLSAFSRSHSSSTPKTPSLGDLDSSDTPLSSPVASPHNRVSIPSVFSAPSPAAPKSMSKLSAFLSSVDTTASVAPVFNAPSQDTKASELAAEATPEEDAGPAIEDNEVEEEEPLAIVAEEILIEKESTNMDAEAEKKSLKKPPSSAKLLAFLQAVEPGSTTLPKEEVSEEEDYEDDCVAMEVAEDILAENEAPAVEEEVDCVEVAETESEVSDVEVESAAMSEKKDTIVEETAPEMHDEVAMETQETLEEEVGAPEDETPEMQEVDAGVSVAEGALVSPEMLQENERLLVENDALTQKLETAETAVATKDTELEAIKQELELLKAQLAEEQTRAHDEILAAEGKQEVLAADAAEVRAELAKLQQTSSESASAAKEVKAMKAQVEELAAQNKSLMVDLTNLREEVQTLEQSVQLARDSEEAARYAAQVAFAARDTADEVNQQLKDQIAQLESRSQ
ncbi:unnamed protein product [Peronospora farinosa]|uniref:Calponin-homology (CH) domain-containing protein n=1 Tax=Peronospora farinosa TaxID=134698 RepID=A0AAV0TH70_9STRA|nr:unnamed protein product [Peronospora farinosa]CAI5721886.1 unnamed protein product [Peronospora farinosa]